MIMVAMSYFCRQNMSQISLKIVANCLHPSEILAYLLQSLQIIWLRNTLTRKHFSYSADYLEDLLFQYPLFQPPHQPLHYLALEHLYLECTGLSCFKFDLSRLLLYPPPPPINCFPYTNCYYKNQITVILS